MRVIAGKFRSRRLRSLAGLEVRPTADRLRETLFDVLSAGNPQALEESVWVDLFAGSGAVGIEALSRGARGAIFVENHPAGAALISRNLASLGIPVSRQLASRKTFAGAGEILRVDALEALGRLAQAGAPVDFVFADPPYAKTRACEEILAFLGQSKLLAPAGRVIAEHRRNTALPAVVGQLQWTRSLEQGDTSLSFYSPIFAA